ncbi:hypothetical protein [Thiomicrorhabdus aquaedulcis]|uniref:hypothetical protein n=1 Tax=Thiomicrorhabdus aquaedulcis TaxID=2211106 RepID=UPI000FD7A48D|nr:hypothetical protein [Thiomicrorhabdus aquaedulcis]
MSVKQDFYAKILSHNLMIMLGWLAQQNIDATTQHRKHIYQVNLAYTASKLKNRLIVLIEMAQGSSKQWYLSLENLVMRISLAPEAIREGRSFKRKLKNIKNDIHYVCYKN